MEILPCSQCFSLLCMIFVGFSVDTLYMVCSCLFLAYWEIYVYLIKNGCWILSNAFQCWYDHMNFILYTFDIVALINFWILNHPSISEINSTSSWHKILSIYHWISFDSICWRILCQSSWKVLVYNIVLFVLSSSGFSISNTGLINWVGRYPNLSVFWNKLYRIGMKSLNVWYNSPVKLSEPGDFVFESLKLQILFQNFRLTISSCLNFGRLWFSRNFKVYWGGGSSPRGQLGQSECNVHSSL